jgi:hypothetical protein
VTDIEQAQWKALGERCEAWKALAYEKLLVSCRTGKRPAEATFRAIDKAKERLGLAT